MTVIWISDYGVQSWPSRRTPASLLDYWPERDVINMVPVRFISGPHTRSPMADILDEFRAMLAKARAPIAILVAAIRDALRCVPRLAAALPGPQCSSSIRRRPRRRDIRHGDALLNVHRMPA